MCIDNNSLVIHKKTDFTELTKDTEEDGEESNNPLEFKVALIFALLFVVLQLLPITRLVMREQKD